MDITMLPPGTKIEKAFSEIREPGGMLIYRFTRSGCTVDVEYATSVFYAPDFFYVRVKDASQNEIWTGGKSLYLDSLFLRDFISERYHRMVLARVNTTESSHSMQVILVDLSTGNEEVITTEGYHPLAGHFISFDAIYYWDDEDIRCLDLETGSEFLLLDLLRQHISGFTYWGVSPVEGCITVCTDTYSLMVFDVRRRVILHQASLPVQELDVKGLHFYLSTSLNGLLVSVDHALIHPETGHSTITSSVLQIEI